MQNISNYQGYTYGDAAAASVLGEKYASDARYRPLVMRNSATAGAASFKVNAFGRAATTTAGRGLVPFDRITIGAGTTNGSTFSNYSDELASWWACWNFVLTDTQLAAVDELISATVAQKSRWVLEGDSIAANSTGYGYHLLSSPGFMGANIDLVQRATGGHTSIQVKDEIGTTAGINDDLISEEFPVFCLVQAGSNDRGDTADAAESFANLRLLWAAARSRGMKVIACTVPGSKFFDSGQVAEFWTGTSGPLSHTVRTEINTLIRADSANYDYLLDVDQLCAAQWGPSYWNNTNCFFDGVHPGTARTSSGSLLMTALAALVEGDMP